MPTYRAEAKRLGISTWMLWKTNNPDAYRAVMVRSYKRRTNFWLARKYGITLKDVNGMLVAQDFACKICKREFVHEIRKNGRPMPGYRVDHNHLTGQVRGLLCNRCNLVIGLAKDDPILLAGIAEYLQA